MRIGLTALLAVCMINILPLSILADCNSCNTTETRCCSQNECINFKKSKAICALLTQNLDAQNTYIKNATFRNLRVLTDETVDNTLMVNGLTTVNENLVINGSLFLNGSLFSSVAFTEYASFVRTFDQLVTSDNTINSIVAFDTPGITPTSGITNTNGVITFASTGHYLINFSTTVTPFDPGNTAFTLTNIPVSGTSNIANTGFASQIDNNNQIAGMVIIEITTPGQQIGVRNFSGGSLTVNIAGAPDETEANVAAAITILKIN